MATISYFGVYSFLELNCDEIPFDEHIYQLDRSLTERDFYVSTIRKIPRNIIDLLLKRKTVKVFLTCKTKTSAICGDLRNIRPFNNKNAYEANCEIIIENAFVIFKPNVMEF